MLTFDDARHEFVLRKIGGKLVDSYQASRLTPKRKYSQLFEHLFLQYGAGSRAFRSFTNYRFWNRLCWTVIALGIVGWAVGLWFLLRLPE